MKKLKNWWVSLSVPWRAWRVIGHVSAADQVPRTLPAKGLVLVTPSEHPTWAVFDCPCRVGHRLLLNLDRAHRPFWSVTSRQPLSIYPSIDDLKPERRCHFIIRGGRVLWIREAYR